MSGSAALRRLAGHPGKVGLTLLAAGRGALVLDQALDYFRGALEDCCVPDIHVPVSEAKAQLTELVRRAEAGDDVVLTRHGHPAVRLVAVKAAQHVADRRRTLEALRKSASAKASPGPAAARSQDFLYDDDGLPR